MTDQKANCRIFLSRFPVCFIFYVLLFLVTSCLLVAVQPCMDWISIKKLSSEFFFKQANSLNLPMEVMKWISSRQDGSLILCHSIYINYFKCMSHYLIFNKWWLHVGYGMMVIHISSKYDLVTDSVFCWLKLAILDFVLARLYVIYLYVINVNVK